MKSLYVVTLCALSLTLSCIAPAALAQAPEAVPAKAEAAAPNAAAPNAVVVAVVVMEGTLARISLQTQLSSKISEVGDEVIGVLYEGIRGADGC